MQTILLLLLIILGANAFWERPEYSDESSEESQDSPSPWEQRRPANHPSRIPSDVLSRDQSHQKSAIETHLAEAEWVCKNQNTGDILILAPQTKSQTKRPAGKPTDTLNKVQGENRKCAHQETTHSDIQTTTNIPPALMGSRGGEGIINTRFGNA